MLSCHDCDMKMIERYIDSMCEELDGAKEYAEYYIIYKNAKPSWAKMYSKMAEDELTHADFVRVMAQEFVDGLTYVSEKDREYWKEAVGYFGDVTATAKLMLSK